MALAERRREREATHLWKWCQRCPSAGCSCVSACEEGCRYHSSVHSPMDWWAACKSRKRSGWVPGAREAKDKTALGIGRGKRGVTLLRMDVPALRSSTHKRKMSFGFKFRDLDVKPSLGGQPSSLFPRVFGLQKQGGWSSAPFQAAVDGQIPTSRC